MTEMFDIYDEALNHIGVKARADVHRDGDWHQTFHCWVIGRDDDGTQFVVLQKRGENQDTFPHKLDISAAGHLQAGETVRDGARELEEELGLHVMFDDLVALGRRVSIKTYKTLIDRQVSHVFLYECNQPLSAYQYQRSEIAGLVKLPIVQGLALLSGEIASVDVEAVGLGQATITITADDFIETVDQYALRVLVLAKRYFANEKYLVI